MQASDKLDEILKLINCMHSECPANELAVQTLIEQQKKIIEYVQLLINDNKDWLPYVKENQGGN
jgi:hypothetical protein